MRTRAHGLQGRFVGRLYHRVGVVVRGAPVGDVDEEAVGQVEGMITVGRIDQIATDVRGNVPRVHDRGGAAGEDPPAPVEKSVVQDDGAEARLNGLLAESELRVAHLGIGGQDQPPLRVRNTNVVQESPGRLRLEGREGVGAGGRARGAGDGFTHGVIILGRENGGPIGRGGAVDRSDHLQVWHGPQPVVLDHRAAFNDEVRDRDGAGNIVGRVCRQGERVGLRIHQHVVQHQALLGGQSLGIEGQPHRAGGCGRRRLNLVEQREAGGCVRWWQRSRCDRRDSQRESVHLTRHQPLTRRDAGGTLEGGLGRGQVFQFRADGFVAHAFDEEGAVAILEPRFPHGRAA